MALSFISCTLDIKVIESCQTSRGTELQLFGDNLIIQSDKACQWLQIYIENTKLTENIGF